MQKPPLPTQPPSGQIVKYLVKKKAVGGPGVNINEVSTIQEDNTNTHEDIKIQNTPSNVKVLFLCSQTMITSFKVSF